LPEYIIYALSAISDYEFYINNSKVIDVGNGTVLFSLNANYQLVLVGQDHIV
jgi:hypothetical protein